MAAFNNGTGGSLSGITSLEDWFCGCVNYLLSQQMNSTKNPTNIKNLDRTINASGAMSGSLVVPIAISSGTGGAIAIAAATYLTGVAWTAPSGGDAAPSNEVIAVIDAARRIKLLELDSTKNLLSANYITEFSVSMGTTSTSGTNGTCTIRWSGFPLDLTVGTNGDSTYSGRPYLS
jgi:hypothetical protein